MLVDFNKLSLYIYIYIKKHNDNKTDNRLLANFNDSGEMSSGPENLHDFKLPINLAITVLQTILFSL